MRYKFFYGLWGCSSNGVLFSPGYLYSIKLPPEVAFPIHTFINKFAYCGMEGDIKLFGFFPEYENFYDPINKELVICRMEYLYIFNRPIMLWESHAESYYKKIEKIKCELRLKSQV